MSVSRRLRFEVLRRDDHKCRYCGGAAPDVALTVDHVKPISLGGGDDPSNLVTACSQCNSGKASVAPDSPMVADVAEDALRWAKAISLASETMLAERDYEAAILEEFDDAWTSWSWGSESNRRLVPRDAEWRQSILRFVSLGLDISIVCDMVPVTMGKERVPPGQKWVYFCGCCWRKLDQLQEMAMGFVDQQSEDA